MAFYASSCNPASNCPDIRTASSASNAACSASKRGRTASNAEVGAKWQYHHGWSTSLSSSVPRDTSSAISVQRLSMNQALFLASRTTTLLRGGCLREEPLGRSFIFLSIGHHEVVH